MDISQQVEAVYRRALLLQQYAVESPVQASLVEKALQELYFVLEELQASQEELHQQNQELITTRESVELERQRYQTLFDLAPNGYLVTDLQGNIYQANCYAADRLFHTSKEYLIKKPLLVFVHERDRAFFQAQLANLNPKQDWEVLLQPHNDAPIAVAIAVTQIKSAQTHEDMLLWSLNDITHRKQLEQQLQTAHDVLEVRVEERSAELVLTNLQLQQEIDDRQQIEQKIREQASLIDIATDAIFVQDLNHHILFWSKGAEQLYGWAAADILRKNVSLLFSQDGDAQLTAASSLIIEQGSWQDELNHVTDTGKVIIVSSRWTLVRDEVGQPQSVLVVNTDITEKKQLELQSYRAQRIESLGSVASGIVHDLNNIFAPILGLAELQLIQQRDLSPQTREVLQIVQRNAQRGVNLAQQITLFARGASGKRFPLRVEDALPDIVKMIQRTFPAAIKIYVNISTQPLGTVLADLTQLHQVVMNLCVNARDAMPDGGTLTLSVKNCFVDTNHAQKHLNVRAGNHVMITVADTGIGIPSALMEHIFEPFFTTKESGKGSGLGLASVFSIVKNHDGFIEVSSEGGKGTQFKVYFPVVQ